MPTLWRNIDNILNDLNENQEDEISWYGKLEGNGDFAEFVPDSIPDGRVDGVGDDAFENVCDERRQTAENPAQRPETADVDGNPADVLNVEVEQVRMRAGSHRLSKRESIRFRPFGCDCFYGSIINPLNEWLIDEFIH